MRTKFIPFFLFMVSIVFADPIQLDSLLHNTWRKHSQSGEEGIIREILKRMQIEKGFFVEFGATDGIFFSNTRFLAEKGWAGAFIEADKQHISKLYDNCKQFKNLQCINEFVTSNPLDSRGKTVDQIAEEHFPNADIDVLSIDIDGTDYLILESLKRKPKIICIETSGYWHPKLQTRIPDFVAKKNLGQPLPVIISIAKQQGYQPVCFLCVNLILVRQDYYHLFDKIKNDPETLWMESWNYLGKHQPGDQRFIYNARHEPLVQQYDPFPTPRLGCH